MDCSKFSVKPVSGTEVFGVDLGGRLDTRVTPYHAVADYLGAVADYRWVMRRATMEGQKPVGAEDTQ